MSTRRARIKAVTSLPPRRKNTEIADKNKQIKECSDKTNKSPRTPKVGTSHEQNTTPHGKSTLESVTRNDKTPVKLLKTPKEKRSGQHVLNDNPQIENLTTSLAEHSKFNVNTVFASPLRRNSPKPTFASPIAPSPKVNKNLDPQKGVTHQKNLPTLVGKKNNENIDLEITESIVSNVRHNSASHGDKDNSNNVIESSNEEAMDGIVPLQSANNSQHKPIDLLKSEIISENAEVLFDPIVPLPSPSKVRPKLRPVPRLGPHRRNSVQGSASESEDESRRNLLVSGTSRQRHDSHTSHGTYHSLPNRDVNRVRNDSVCSSVSQVTAQPLLTGSPIKEKQNVKIKRQEMSRRMLIMRRRRENVKRDSLTMYDLIFYNPTTNPIVPDAEEMNIKEANVKEELERTKTKEVVKTDPPKDNAAPVPQIKLGPKGEIILDEESLVIKQTNSDRAVSSVVHESGWSNGTSSRYKRGRRGPEWSAAETVRFYRALAAIGTDFTLMAPLFPDHSRKELKSKFKREEKLNGTQVDKALRAKVPWDVLKLKDEFKEERVAAVKRQEKERERIIEEKKAEKARLKAAREVRVRQSRGSKALESTMLPGMSSHHKGTFTAEDIIERANNNNKHQRKRKSNCTETLSEETPSLSSLIRTRGSRATENDSGLISKTTTPVTTTTTTPPPPPILQIKAPEFIDNVPQIPSNIEKGSLVVLTVNDPSSPAKKVLQTYIACGPGKLTPVSLPAVLLSSVVGYMKKNTPKSYSPSSHIISPSSVTSHDSRNSSTSAISVLPSPTKRTRHNSLTITHL